MIKTIFFDIDGTLLPFETRKMSEKTTQSLSKLKEKGYFLGIASEDHLLNGRS